MNQKASELRQAGQVGSVIIDGINIEYWRAGNGNKTIVFIHGNSSCKEVFCEQLNNLDVNGLSLISVDLPGHGGSADAIDPQDTYTIPGYASLVGKLLEDLGMDSYSVIGWSLGGNIAIEMAGQNLPLNSLLIMGVPPIGPGIENIEKAFLPSSLEAPGKAELTDIELDEFTHAIYCTLDPIPEIFYRTAKRTDGMAREVMIGHWMGGGSGHKQIDTVANWGKPIAVIHGGNEPFVSLNYLKNCTWLNLWQEKIHIIDGVGHASFIENPEEFNSLLAAFIKEVA